MTASRRCTPFRLSPRAGLATALVLLALPLAAGAHSGADAGTHHGLVAGLSHPFTGLDHLAAMLAVGLWSGGTARRAWVAPAAFALLLLVGAGLAMGGFALPAMEPMIAASLLVLGLLLAGQARLPAPVAAGLVGGFALFHGAAHGSELAGAAALGGMLLGTLVLQGLGLLLGRVVAGRATWLPRLAGAALAVFGGALLLA